MPAMGESRKKVVLFGQSLTLTSIGASLQMHEQLEVLPLDESRPSSSEELLALEPTAVIFDLGTVSPDSALSLLDAQPDLLLIGLDAAGDKLLVLTGQQAHALTTTDLLQAILEGRADYLANRPLEQGFLKGVLP